MDNEQPWQPPEQQKTPHIPQITPQVPDLTIFSPSNKLPATKSSNFLQRAKANENIPKPQKSSSPSNLMFNNVKPSVPDVSLFEFSPTSSARPVSSSSNLMFAKSQKSSKENIFDGITMPSVPDVTIMEEKPKQVKPTSGPNQVFSESYKKMLLNSHEQFIRQLRKDVSPTAEMEQKKKFGLFSHQNKFQDNPLRKYAPKPPPVVYELDANSSSILVEFEDAPPTPEDKSDEITFKKVAEMLSEIQRLVIPGKSPTETNLKRHEILRHLAASYLTPEELQLYAVERELTQMEKDEG